MTTITPFAFADTHTVRTVLIDGEPWFVAKDVCEVVGIVKHRDAIAQLDADERASTAVDTPGGRQQMSVVNESGLYSLMLISRSPKVREFKRWVTHEVLPQIRKTGQFGSALPTSFAEALELAAAQARELEAAEAKIAIDAPKVEAYDAFMDADGFYPMAAAARMLGFGRTTFFRMLRDAGILQRGSNLPYRQFDHHFKVTTSHYEDSAGVKHATYTTRVLPTGIDFLRKRLERQAIPA